MISTGRTQIAAALSTVADVKGHRYRPTVPNIGDGWPLWSAMDREAGKSFETTWRILVFLPQDEQKASDWIDAHAEMLVDAVEEHVAFVDRLEPVLISVAGKDQYALQLTVRSE